MSTSALMLHRGARLVEQGELDEVPVPLPDGRWYPLSHGNVLDTVKGTLGEAGFIVRRQQLGLSQDNARFFGVLDLETALTAGVTLSVGVRNSTDKTFPLGFCAGSRVFCCDNLAFRSELLVRRKHTRYGEQRFAQAIASAVTHLSEFRLEEGNRIRSMMRTDISELVAESLILKAFEKGIVTTPNLPQVIKEWREPTFEDFQDRTYWSLFNAFTTAMGERVKTNPQAFATQTMRLYSHLEPPKSAIAI